MKRVYTILASISIVVLAGCGSKSVSNDSDQSGGGDELSSEFSNAPDSKSSKAQASTDRSKGKDRARGPINTGKLAAAKQTGNDEDMREAVTAALMASPNDLTALNTLAMHHLKKGRIGLAKTILQRAYTGHERSAALQNNLGLIYMAEGDLQAAILAFKEALSLDSRLISASANLGSIYAKYGDYDRALPLLEIAAHYSPNDMAIALNMAICLGVKGKSRRAMELYDKVLSQDPRNASALFNYSILLVDYENNMQDGASMLNRLKLVGPTSDMAERVTQLERKLADSGKR